MKLEVEHLRFAYGSAEPIFTDITFSVESGETICLLGPNGCGKTTLLNCTIGLNRNIAGTIRVDGMNTAQLSDAALARTLGYVPQDIIPSFDYTVLDYVVTGCAPHMKLFKRPGKAEYERARAAIDKMGIGHLAGKSYAQISGGERQQVSIARVLTQKPDFILLDEPTSHLDFGNQIHVLKVVAQMANEGFGVLMTTHNPNHALMLDGNVVMMRKGGGYTFGAARDIVTEESLRSLYGTDIIIEDFERVHRPVCIAPSL